MPAPPSTSTRAPSGMRLVASTTLTTHGMPSSRLTMTAWLFMRADVDDHAAGGHEQRRPRRIGLRRDQDVAGLERRRVAGVEDHPRRPRTTPAQPGPPVRTSPDAAPVDGLVALAEERAERRHALVALDEVRRLEVP